ncbi:MAG: NCS2 family permease [Candidatus Sumerlaeia bacterium]|nr:NCS2 family permease [Candidatus Sumerlaeia bacterium]
MTSSAPVSLRTEVLAGVTTFMTMAYIIFVNAQILGGAVDIGPGTQSALVTATCLAAAIPSILMGLVARLPVALAPGMGMNAFFVSVCISMGVDWRHALGAVFVFGALFLVLTVLGLRQVLVRALPRPLLTGIAAGIGLFLAYIGLRNGGLITLAPFPEGAPLMTQLGPLRSPDLWVTLFGLLAIGALLARRVPGAILWGILLAAGFHHAVQLLRGEGLPEIGRLVSLPSFALFGALDVRGVLRPELFEVLIVLLYLDMFDSIGTLMAVSKEGDLLDAKGELPQLNRALFVDAFGSSFGAVAGTSTVTSYIESASGIAAGGRTGLTAIVVGLLFLAGMFFAPVAGLIPACATAPALIVIGVMMLRPVCDLDWSDWATLIPAFLVILMTALTNAINIGIAFGFVTYPLLMLLAGRGRQVSPLVYLLGALFVLRYVFISS